MAPCFSDIAGIFEAELGWSLSLEKEKLGDCKKAKTTKVEENVPGTTLWLLGVWGALCHVHIFWDLDDSTSMASNTLYPNSTGGKTVKSKAYQGESPGKTSAILPSADVALHSGYGINKCGHLLSRGSFYLWNLLFSVCDYRLGEALWGWQTILEVRRKQSNSLTPLFPQGVSHF